MITNELQYNKVRRELVRAVQIRQKHLDWIRNAQDPRHNKIIDTSARQQEVEHWQQVINSLTVELHDYKQLTYGKVKITGLETIKDIGNMLVRARIACRWTHKEFAARAGLSEQQVQRYEKQRYSSASLRRLIELVRIFLSVLITT